MRAVVVDMWGASVDAYVAAAAGTPTHFVESPTLLGIYRHMIIDPLWQWRVVQKGVQFF